MKKIILVYLSDKRFYQKSKIKVGVPSFPSLTLATLAAPLIKEGSQVKVFDFNIPRNNRILFNKLLIDFKPDIVGITFTTPLFEEMRTIARVVKDNNYDICVVIGGAHASSFPEDSLKDSLADVCVVGEGDLTVADIAKKSLNKIKGIYYKKGNKIIKNPPRELIENLDKLSYPAWHLFNLKDYYTPKIIARKNPVGWIETSRGCVFGCTYCNKNIFGRKFRVKSPERVVDEIQYMLKCGFKEIHLAEDGFTTDIDRAKKICRLIIQRRLKFPWATVTGIRADRVDYELLRLMKKAGCYRVYYGIESGNQNVVNRIQKGLDLEKVKLAVKLAKKAKLEVFGFFMIGLPGETKREMQDTIDFAKKLKLDLAKMSITIPLPGTALYNDLKQKGLIKSKDWSDFNYYVTPKKLYDHDNLDWATIEKYYNKFYRTFYLNPFFIMRRLKYSIVNGTIFEDIKGVLTTKWF